MKKILLLCAGMALIASTAFAQAGADLSVVGCPLDGGVSDAGTLDCAGGAVLVLLGSFEPAEAITDLVGINFLIDIGVSGGDINTTANFWDLSTSGNSAALNGSHLRPASGCSSPTVFTNTWNQSGAGFNAVAGNFSPTHCRISGLCFRPGNLSVVAGQKLFGMQVTIDASTSAEGGGTALGCTLPVAFVLNELDPGSAANNPVTNLQHGNLLGNCVAVNGGSNLCGAVPTQRHTWGQLKSLYR